VNVDFSPFAERDAGRGGENTRGGVDWARGADVVLFAITKTMDAPSLRKVRRRSAEGKVVVLNRVPRVPWNPQWHCLDLVFAGPSVMLMMRFRGTLWTFAALAVHCSAAPPGDPAKMADAQGGLTDGGVPDAGEVVLDGGCQWPAIANSFDGTSGCKPVAGGCDVGSHSMAGYHLVCVGTDGAPSPPDSLNCNSLPVPTNIENSVHFCCACMN
jgi:hypothetical protein